MQDRAQQDSGGAGRRQLWAGGGAARLAKLVTELDRIVVYPVLMIGHLPLPLPRPAAGSHGNWAAGTADGATDVRRTAPGPPELPSGLAASLQVLTCENVDACYTLSGKNLGTTPIQLGAKRLAHFPPSVNNAVS
jgi:hypothetical protein